MRIYIEEVVVPIIALTMSSPPQTEEHLYHFQNGLA